MNILDVVLLIILASFVLSVYKDGFIKEFFSKLAFIGSAIVAFALSPLFAFTTFKSLIKINNEPLLYIISFLCVFVISFLIIKIIGSIIGIVFEFPILKSLDKALGVVLGAIEGIIIISLIIEILIIQNIFPCDDLINKSLIAPMIIENILQIKIWHV